MIIFIGEYTRCSILIAAGKNLEKYERYEKTFKIKIVWFERGDE